LTDAFVPQVKVNTWAIVEQIDFDRYNETPTSRHLENHGVAVLNPATLQTTELHIRSNKIEARDGLIQIGLEGIEYEFFDILNSRSYYQKAEGEALLAIQCVLSPQRREIRRIVYDLLAVLADLGGVRDVLISLMGVVMFSLAEQQFNLKFMKSMFLVKQEHHPGEGDRGSKEKKRKHYKIRLTYKDQFMLWASNYFGAWICSPCWKNQKRVMKLYKEGCERIEGNLDVI